MERRVSLRFLCPHLFVFFIYSVIFVRALPSLRMSFQMIYVNFMRKVFLLLPLLAILVGCGKESAAEKEKNVFESCVEVYENAIEDVRKAKNEEELALIVERTYDRIDSVGLREEMEACMVLLNNGDTLALKEYEPSMEAVLNAADRYMDAVAVAVAGLADGNR